MRYTKGKSGATAVGGKSATAANLLGLIGSVHIHHVLAGDPTILMVDDGVNHPVPDRLRAHKLRALNVFQLYLENKKACLFFMCSLCFISMLLFYQAIK